MEEFENPPIDECNCELCYYDIHDCENSCPRCDIEVKEELNGKENKIDIPKFYLYEYLEDSNCFYNLGKFTANELPTVNVGNKILNYFDDGYDSALKMFNRIVIPE